MNYLKNKSRAQELESSGWDVPLDGLLCADGPDGALGRRVDLGVEDVLAVVEGWDPRCAAILSKAPSCVDWKLVYRDPLPTWISKGARLALIGDAAHPFLP